MKILIINTLYHPYKIGGAEVSVQILAEELVTRGNVVRILTLHPHAKIEKKVINGVEVIYLPLRNIYWPFTQQIRKSIAKIVWHLIDTYNPMMAKLIEKELDDFQPDIVHTNNISGFSVSTWDVIKKYKLPLVHTCRDYYLFHHNTTLFKDGKNMVTDSKLIKMLSYIKKKKSTKVDCFVGISKFISELHSDAGYASYAKHCYIYNPINHLDIVTTSSAVIRIGFIGRLSTDKGFDHFCELSVQYFKKGEMEFFAAGNITASDESESLLKKALSSNVNLLGFVSTEEFLSNIDIVILPNKWNEPFGRTLAEAASAGKYVFVTLTGGAAEIAEMYENVFELSTFSYEKALLLKSKKNYQISCELFSAKKLTSQYLDVYIDCLKHFHK